MNPYSPPQEAAGQNPYESVPHVARRLGLIWDVALASVFVWYFPSMVRNTASLLFEQPFDALTTLAKLPERWILAFFLLSISYYLARPRGAVLRVIYAVMVASFLFQHRMDFGDIVTALFAALVFSPVLARGFGWLGLLQVSAQWLVREIRRKTNPSQ